MNYEMIDENQSNDEIIDDSQSDDEIIDDNRSDDELPITFEDTVDILQLCNYDISFDFCDECDLFLGTSNSCVNIWIDVYHYINLINLDVCDQDKVIENFKIKTYDELLYRLDELQANQNIQNIKKAVRR